MKKVALLAAISLPLSLSCAPVFAKSTIGGIVFLNTFYDNAPNNLTLANASNSRLRIRWNNEDKVGMYFEFGIGAANNVRHAFGTWDFSETGQLLAGATSTPFAPLNPSVAMVHNSGQGYGSISPSRPSQLRYTYKFLNRHGAAAIALVDPNNGTTPVGATREQRLPRLDLGLAYRTANWQIFPGAFVQRVTLSTGTQSLTATGVSLGAKTAKGAFTLSGEFGFGKNWGNTRMSISGSTAGNNAVALYTGGNKDADNKNTGFWLDGGYRFGKGEIRGTAHLIYGQMTSKASGGGTTIDAKSTMIGVSVPIDVPFIARGLRFRPELFHFKDKDTGTTAVDTSNTIIGVQVQYTF